MARPDRLVIVTQCCTQPTFFKQRHYWKIKNFSFYATDKILESSTFSAAGFDGLKWNITLHPKGDGPARSDWVSLYLHLVSCDKADVRVKFQFSILDAEDDAIQSTRTPEALEFKEGDGYGFNKFIQHNHIRSLVKKLCNDELCICCEMLIAIDPVNVAGPRCSNQSRSPKEISSEVSREQSGSQMFSDFVLVLNGKQFHVHTAVLFARSRVFKNLFERNRRTKENLRVNVVGIHENTFLELLRLIYTGAATVSDAMVNDLNAAIETSKLAIVNKRVMNEDFAFE